ncbi:type II toxin-antitoxin system RelB/DinJ family antitoxin [Candidatus Parcubacteria bacterium]|nr:type II toxin-antitoxin system RelB/DinJ family antitoxin [Candidatus Parcubacteria bacterium]
MTNLTIRIDEKLKKETKKTLEKHGLDMSTAVKMFFNQVVIQKGLPFLPTHDPKKIREEWDREVEDALKNGKRYTSVKDLFDDILD